jgi:hypothetical protein
VESPLTGSHSVGIRATSGDTRKFFPYPGILALNDTPKNPSFRASPTGLPNPDEATQHVERWPGRLLTRGYRPAPIMSPRPIGPEWPSENSDEFRRPLPGLNIRRFLRFTWPFIAVSGNLVYSQRSVLTLQGYDSCTSLQLRPFLRKDFSDQ